MRKETMVSVDLWRKLLMIHAHECNLIFFSAKAKQHLVKEDHNIIPKYTNGLPSLSDNSIVHF